MENLKYKIIIILLALIIILSVFALFALPYKVLFSALLVISMLGLIVYYLFGNNTQTSHKTYINMVIVEELDSFFQKNKPYLNTNYKISDLEKQLKVTRKAISLFTKERFGINFNQFLNLWRIAEFNRLRSLPENKGVDIDKLCVKAGFRNTQHYYLARKERKERNKGKNKPVFKKQENDILNDLNVKKKPEIQLRV